ncbi:MAG TPA: FtsX-like permease family protein [Conexibacter sp.]|nr:FtsX-like permease family protein [Conexibacter sp.]
MSLRTLVYLYGWRLRAHPFQELLAGAGIAIGVALLFAVQVANTSMTGSAAQTVGAITGGAQLELAARDDQGFDARLTRAVRALDGVRVAAPVLDRRSVLVGPRGERAVTLVGVDATLAALGGPITHDFGPNGLQLPTLGIVAPDEIAQQIGATAGESVRVFVAGRARTTPLSAALDRGEIGSLVGSQVAISSLPYVQRLTGMPNRVSRIFVEAKRGQERLVRGELRQLAHNRLDVGPADSVVRRLRVAAAPSDQSSALFAAISAMVGLLFAFNAMLLTMPDRRAFIAELRMQGFTGRQVVGVVVFQALLLGFAASAAGLALGDVLSRTVFDSLPAYLAFTFPIGTQRIITAATLAIAFGAGVAAALLAASRPLLDLLVRRPLDAVHDERGELGEGLGQTMRRRMLVVAVVLVAATTLAVVLAPQLTVVGLLALSLAALLAMPATFAATMPLTDRLARRLHRNMLLVAVMGARSAMTRSVAVAAIAAIAVYGNVAIGGARDDLIRGLEAGYADHLSTADVWVTTAGQSLTTDGFQVSARQLARVRHAPGVTDVRVYQGGMLDAGDQRTWIIARPPGDRRIIPPSQLVGGDLASAERHLHTGGWAAVSRTIVDQRHLRIGDAFDVPTPAGPLRLRLAAIVTNLSWGPGAIIVSTTDYQRGFRTHEATALEVNLRRGVSPAAGRRAVAAALGDNPALDVQTRAELDAEFRSLLHQGLARLSQIATLMLIAAILALAAAMSASVWQRRRRLAAYKVQGFKERQLRRILLLETVLVLVLGCTLGVVAGTYAHLLGNRWLELNTGFPAPFSAQVGQAVTTLLLITVGAAAVVAFTGFLATRVSARISFGE